MMVRRTAHPPVPRHAQRGDHCLIKRHHPELQSKNGNYDGCLKKRQSFNKWAFRPLHKTRSAGGRISANRSGAPFESEGTPFSYEVVHGADPTSGPISASTHGAGTRGSDVSDVCADAATRLYRI